MCACVFVCIGVCASIGEFVCAVCRNLDGLDGPVS